GSFGEKKVMVSSAAYLGGGANLLIATSVFQNGGQAHYFPEVSDGTVADVDGERGYHTFANLIWRDWNVLAYFNSREKQPPMNWEASALLNNRGSRVQDQRNFLRASNTRPVGANGKLRWSLSYDQYRYDDRFFYPLEEDVQDFRNIAR